MKWENSNHELLVINTIPRQLAILMATFINILTPPFYFIIIQPSFSSINYDSHGNQRIATKVVIWFPLPLISIPLSLLQFIFPNELVPIFRDRYIQKGTEMAVKPVGSCSPGLTKLGLGFMGLFIAAYILGPPLYWHFMEGLAAFSSSSSSSTCPPCFCDCSSQTDFAFTDG